MQTQYPYHLLAFCFLALIVFVGIYRLI